MKSSIQKHEIDGQMVSEIVLTNAFGLQASILSYGAVLRDLRVPMTDGTERSVVLGYTDVSEYTQNAPYLGAIVGRVCNRIDAGAFTLDGQSYQLPVNGDGNVHLHGGVRGFARRNWDVVEYGDDFVLLRLLSEHGDEGYPGEVTVTCLYRLTREGGIRIEIEGVCDAPTLINMTNHSYFSLGAEATSEHHWLEIAADFVTPTHANQIPTGEVMRVEDVGFDFRSLRQIDQAHEINFVTQGERGVERAVAVLQSPERDLEMVALTDQPCLLLYTGAGLPDFDGFDGHVNGPSGGLCLEAAGFCNAINTQHFPAPIVRPGDVYRNSCEYRFRVL